MSKRVQKVLMVLTALTVWPALASAQVMVGDNTSLSAGGDLGFGYSGTSEENVPATRALGFAGNGWLRGYYYKPQFLSFDVQPYYRRSQSDSVYQTITNGSGFTANTSIFSGTHFPGFVSYSRTFDDTGQFGVPGIPGITSHGDGRNFAIGWNAFIPHLPTLTASYSTTAGSSTVFGANTESNASSRNLTLQSTYRIAGFDLLGQYLRLSTKATFPGVFEGEQTQKSNTASNQYMINAGHKLPMTGHWNLVWNHTDFGGEYQSGTTKGLNDGAVNDLNTMFSLNPTPKLGLAFGADYNDNVFGALQQRLLQAGAPPLPKVNTSLRMVSVNGQASYALFSHVSLYGRAIHYEQWLSGESRGLTQFSGNADFNYAKSFLGALTFSVGVIDTATEQGNTGASLVGNVNYLRHFRTWEFGGEFGYMQQVQTLFAVYSTSTYRYGSQVRRRFNHFQWSGSFNGSHSGLSHFAGFSSRSETYSSNLSLRRFAMSGQYSQSAGTSILTSSGLIEVPSGVPAPLLSELILYNGKSYGGGASLSPLRRLSLSATYNKAYSSTAGPAAATAFNSNILNYRLQYRLRKLYIDGNFTRFRQSINTALLPARIDVYYIRVSRWFKIF